MRNLIGCYHPTAFHQGIQLADNLVDELTLDDIEPFVGIAVNVKRRSSPRTVLEQEDAKAPFEV